MIVRMEEQPFDMSKLHDSISEVIISSLNVGYTECLGDKSNNNLESKENKCTNIDLPKELISNNNFLVTKDCLNVPISKSDKLFTNSSAKKDLLCPTLISVRNQEVVKKQHLQISDETKNTNSEFKKENILDTCSSAENSNIESNSTSKYPIFADGTPRRIKLISKKKEIATTVKNDGMTGIFKIPVKKIIEENLSVSLLKTQLKRTLTSCLQSPPVKRLATTDDSSTFDEHLHFSPISTQDILLLEDENKLQSLTFLNTIKNGRRIANITKTKYSNLTNFIPDENIKTASKVHWCEVLSSVCESILPEKLPSFLTFDTNRDSTPPESTTSQKEISLTNSTSEIQSTLVNNVALPNEPDDEYFLPSPLKTYENNNCDYINDSSTTSEINLSKAIKPILNLNKTTNNICPFYCQGSINVIVMQSRRQSSTFLSASII